MIVRVRFLDDRSPLLITHPPTCLLLTSLLTDTRASNRTRHIALRERYVSEKAAEGMMKIVKVSSVDQVADMFTKPLSQSGLMRHSSALGLSLASTISSPPDPTTSPLPRSTPATVATCLLCRAEFPSKNKLHAHIRSSHSD